MKPAPFTLRSLAADSTLALGIKVISLPLGYLTSLAIARLWGAEVLGTYTLAFYLVTTLSVLCRLGLDTGMLRFGASLRAAGQGGGVPGLFWRGLFLVLCLSGTAAVGMYLAGGWLARVFHAPSLLDLLYLAALALPVVALAVFCGETVRSLGGARWVVAQQDLLTPFGLLLLVFFLAPKGSVAAKSPGALGVAFLVSSLLGLGFLAAILRPYLREHREAPGRVPIRHLLRYSWPLYLSALFMLAFGALDSLVLGVFTGPEKVAYFESANRTALLVSLPLLAVNAIVPPLFAQFHQKGRVSELEGVAQATARWMYYVSLPLALFTVALSPEILGLFGPGFGEARWALGVLVLAQLVSVACGSVGFLLAMTGHQLTLTLILGLGGAIGIPLMAVGAALFGLNGLALAKGLWLVGVNVLMSLGVWRHLGVKVFAVGVGWPTLSGLAGVALFWLIRPYLGVWGAACVGGLGYLVLVTRTLYQEFTDIMLQTRWEAIR
jgi:O-antigen/teichoic acid export membrane protein